MQLSLNLAPHNNHFLFSDHYLEEHLRRRPEWEEATKQAKQFREWLQPLYEKERDHLANYSESQLEDHWFKPILQQLGHTFEGQPTVPGLKANAKKPDFVLFPDGATRQAAVSEQNTANYAQHALSVVEVKKWTVDLSRKLRGGGTRFDNQNPMFQIDYYLRATNLTWGIVSNGRLWRLVHKDSSYKLDIYFEIDLEQALLAEGDSGLARLVYFVLFFGQSAFRQPDPFLDQTLNESIAFARALETDLAENAYKALEHLIAGYFTIPSNGLDLADPADRQAVYTNSLYLLYRILFLLYGESRGLLPLENEGYQRYSLSSLTAQVADLDGRGKLYTLPPMLTQFAKKLRDLFAIINGHRPELNEWLGVSRYNGGLFSPEQHPFLEEKAVGDQHLAQAIDYLARRLTDENIKETVDYRTLGVRQLGSIYEGLLEYQPQLATAPMVSVRRKGKEMWVLADKQGRSKTTDRREPGELYLATDKGERKATGSYYTPDYIVKYIVAQTLEPLVARAREQAEQEATDAQRAKRFIAEILALNVLDPAMGSGHFLVEATDFLAVAIAGNEWVESEAVGEETDVLHWRRRVVEACIYGVDKNALAVELAKLSLWLVTAAKDRPLSFLDHHLRRGDSLVGARLADLHTLPTTNRQPPTPSGQPPTANRQPPLFPDWQLTQTMNRAVADFMQIESLPSDDVAAVHAKEETLRQLEETHLARWRRLANLWTSVFFGNGMSPEEYRDVARHILQGSGTMSEAQAEQFLYHPAMQNNDFFHWELAFPEVFFDRFGNRLGDPAGFDAIIGNPPYIRQENINHAVKSFYAYMYRQVYHGVADIYVYFLGLGLDILRHQGFLGLITSSLFRQLNYGKPLRSVLTSQSHILTIVDFDTIQVFEGATTYPIILITTKRPAPKSGKMTVIRLSANFQHDLATNSSQICILPKGSKEWSFIPHNLRHVIEGWEQSTPLEKFLRDGIYRGVTTGFNPAFIISNNTFEQLLAIDKRSKDLIKPYIRGEDIKPWHFSDNNLFLIFTRRGVNINDYPAIKEYLQQYRTFLEPRPKNWDKSKKWEGRKPGKYMWYEIQDSVEYFRVFENPRIHSTKVSLQPSFQISNDVMYGANTSYVLSLDDLVTGFFLLAMLNSSVSKYYCQSVFAPKANGYYEIQPKKLSEFPIPVSLANFEISFERLEHIIPLVEEFNQEEILEWTRNNLPASYLSKVCSLLAYLAKILIKIYANREELIQRFFTDLEGIMPDEKQFATLRDKGKWEQSVYKAVPSAQAFVRPDSRSSVTLADTLDWNEAAYKGFIKLMLKKVRGLSDLVAVYNDHAPAYRALTERIAWTDNLIDQIVYRLYGLTDEEIAIVEGSSG